MYFIDCKYLLFVCWRKKWFLYWYFSLCMINFTFIDRTNVGSKINKINGSDHIFKLDMIPRHNTHQAPGSRGEMKAKQAFSSEICGLKYYNHERIRFFWLCKNNETFLGWVSMWTKSLCFFTDKLILLTYKLKYFLVKIA